MLPKPERGFPTGGIQAEDTSLGLEKLASLPPVFRDRGNVTAGNSSTLNDGASAVLLMSCEAARAHGLAPLARLLRGATAGVDPRLMGIGPVPATTKLLERTGVTINDLGIIELNEAFAAQSLAVLWELGVDPYDEKRFNPNGGAIALGHPLGCSGTASSPRSYTRCDDPT